MKLALECDASILDWVQPFGDFEWVLAKEYKDNEEYANYYRESTRFKYIDNSVNEELEPLPLEVIKEVFEDCKGNLVVAPDWLGDREKTLQGYLEAIEIFGEEKVVGVLQGQTMDEVLDCLRYYRGSIVAVPYDILSKRTDAPWLMGLRRNTVVAKIPESTRVHLLGYTSMEELDYYGDMHNVISIDTGVPIMLGLNELDILDPLESKSDPTLKRMRDPKITQEKLTAMYRNLALLRKVISR